MIEVLIRKGGQTCLVRFAGQSTASAIHCARAYSPECEIVNVRKRVRRITRGGSMPGAANDNRSGSYYRQLAAA